MRPSNVVTFYREIALQKQLLITLNWFGNMYAYFQICIEAQPSHPFFVYGKGWASFDEKETFMEHGLKCSKLEVGDVCISLTPREKAADVTAAPQNLSRRQMPQTVSTTATGTAVTSRPITSYEPYSQQVIQQRHPNEPMYGHHARAANSDSSARKYNTTMAPPPPPLHDNPYDDEAIDATMHSRKRRAWSITENVCDNQKKNKPNWILTLPAHSPVREVLTHCTTVDRVNFVL